MYADQQVNLRSRLERIRLSLKPSAAEEIGEHIEGGYLRVAEHRLHDAEQALAARAARRKYVQQGRAKQLRRIDALRLSFPVKESLRAGLATDAGVFATARRVTALQEAQETVDKLAKRTPAAPTDAARLGLAAGQGDAIKLCHSVVPGDDGERVHLPTSESDRRMIRRLAQ